MGNDRPAIRSDEGEAQALERQRRGRARTLAVALQVLALCGAAVAAARDGLPSALGIMVLLLVAAALCVNRQALFPVELSVTAEASVIVCAVVLFRDDAPVLAPVLLGLACGWLDSEQWASRAWVPMAFNSGNRGVEAMCTALSFYGVTSQLGSSPGAIAGAAVVAAAVFCVVDNLAIVTLVVLRDGVAVRRAAREVVPLDALGFPIALLGAGAGLLGLATTAWVGAIALLPAAGLLEALVTGKARAPRRVLGRAVAGSISIACAFAVGSFVGFPPFPVTAALIAIGLAAGMELVVDRGLPVPPALGAVVVLAVGAVAPSHATIAAVLVAGTATSVSWAFEKAVRPAKFVIAVGCVVGAAVTAGVVAQAGASTLVVAVAFSLAAVAAAPRRATALALALAWTFPLVVIGASSSDLRAWHGPVVTLLVGSFVVTVAATLIAWAGAPAWRSRIAGRAASRHIAWSHRRVKSTAAGAVVVLATLALVAPHRSAIEGAAVVSLAVVSEVTAALALSRVRLWRFRRRRRATEIAVLSVAVGLAWWSASSAAAGQPGLGLGLALAAGGMAITAGWSTVAVADRSVATRMQRGCDRDEVSR